MKMRSPWVVMPFATGTFSAITRNSPFGRRALTRSLITSVMYIAPCVSNARSSGATTALPTGTTVRALPEFGSSALIWLPKACAT